MTETLLALGSAAWLGILTSISPCPLASNVAAVAFVGKSVASPRRALLAGIFYALGRALTYVLVAVLVISSLLSIPGVSLFLQERMNQVLGPLLIVIGIVLFGWLRLPLASWRWNARRAGRSGSGGIAGGGTPTGKAASDGLAGAGPLAHKAASDGLAGAGPLAHKAASGGVAGAGALGMLFALSFCPVSAGLFFGGLIPLAVQHGSRVVVPAVYGLGTGLPVVLFAILLVLGMNQVGRAFHVLTSIEKAARPATAAVFVMAGLYLTATHILGWNV